MNSLYRTREEVGKVDSATTYKAASGFVTATSTF
jgi:hypothetical protein